MALALSRWRLASTVMRKIEMMKKSVSRLLCLGLLFTFTLIGRVDVSVRASSGAPYSSQWRITGPSGGDVRSLVVDPNDPDLGSAKLEGALRSHASS